MRRSKLETCIDILDALARHNSLKTTHLMNKANVNFIVLKKHLDFLIEQGAIEERLVGKNRIVYTITKRGLDLSNCFKNLKPVNPTVRNGIDIPLAEAKHELFRNQYKNY